LSQGPRRTIVGQWLEENGQIVGDQECRLIDQLVADHLVKRGSRDAGWTELYHDPSDGSYWELTYPQSHMHGGGPPTLTQITDEEVQTLYGTLKPD
jgi:hypothetical protein